MKKNLAVILSIILFTLPLSACGKPSKEECEQLFMDGKLKEFQEGECVERFMEDFGF
ncbi:hypothetical protein HNQ94_002153 [Salirhabdus euzebyi]|uniref:Lipoprotein n=1 Tax=Salirhabdus euzebyi TaxID=394506 RepID=A0A841Q5P8_9BACI|nr:hypothetical protein [Salirhabdus euzebyi]MBB6453704.1 hypothetical protein [Salirhabdus euzebyi]